MKEALYSIISPKALEPLFKSKEAQLRNFLIVHLLLNYGLRTGELLLLTLNSIKTDLKTCNTYLVITDTQDRTDNRISKPQMKNVQSVRTILLEKRDAQFIHMYINNIRSRDSKSHMLFLSLQAPYAPLSKSGLKKLIATINEKIKSKHPQFFDKNYVDSIDKISAHILRHTWAYMMLKHSYQSYLDSYNKAQAMENAIESLRKMAGWSLNSTMPYLYASRFISENANLANIQRITKVGAHYDH
ncbi:site-specific integrase [Psychrobacter sp. JCM 18903]|uniref:site-specific integrase n=1 Tax=Psychrobacter sp. JCM 18903 TaxID=1298610 RepID=UPI001A9F87CF|nr:site-specific integrase [Psychrobacter sp. JCM 18903]